MIFSLYYLYILIVATATLLSAIYFVIKIYLEYKIPSHLLMAMAFLFMEISLLIFCVGGLIFGAKDIDAPQLLLSRQIGNGILVFGYLFVFYGFLHYRRSGVSYLSNVLSVLAGMLFLAMFFPGWITLTYDSSMNRINGQFSTQINLMIMPLIFVFTILWFQPLLKYSQKKYSMARTKSGRYQLVGFSFLLFWIGTTPFTQVGELGAIRGLIAYFPWIFWALSIRSNPLILCHSETSANWLLILHESGIPLNFYSFSENQPQDLDLASGLFTAIESALHDVLSSNTPLSSVNYKDKTLLFHHAGNFKIILNSNTMDPMLLIALQILGKRFQTRFHDPLTKDPSNITNFRAATELIQEIFVPLLSEIENPTY